VPRPLPATPPWHTAVSVIGTFGRPGSYSLQFLGNTGNIAHRLEQQNKQFASTLVVSDAVLRTAGLMPPPGIAWTEVRLRGREDAPLQVMLARNKDDIVFATMLGD
jgi:adenylate cyclase